MKHLFIYFILLTSFTSFSNVVILNGLTHKYKGDSGDVLEGEVVLLNTSKKAQRVFFTLNDAIFSCNQKTYFSGSESHSRSSNLWFSSELLEKELIAGEKFVYKFKLIIPQNQELKGSYWSVLMVNVEEPIMEQVIEKGIGIKSKIRYAIQLLTDVNQLDEMQLDFTDVKLNDSKQLKKSLAVSLQNKGMFIEPTEVVLEVYNEDGMKIHVLNTIQQNVFPSMCRSFNMDVSILESGTYQCIILAQSRDQYIGTNLTLNIK